MGSTQQNFTRYSIKNTTGKKEPSELKKLERQAAIIKHLALLFTEEISDEENIESVLCQPCSRTPTRTKCEFTDELCPANVLKGMCPFYHKHNRWCNTIEKGIVCKLHIDGNKCPFLHPDWTLMPDCPMGDAHCSLNVNGHKCPFKHMRTHWCKSIKENVECQHYMAGKCSFLHPDRSLMPKCIKGDAHCSLNVNGHKCPFNHRRTKWCSSIENHIECKYRFTGRCSFLHPAKALMPDCPNGDDCALDANNHKCPYKHDFDSDKSSAANEDSDKTSSANGINTDSDIAKM